MDTTEKALVDFILEQSKKEISYEEHLEQQKILLLAQKEVENWKRLVYETERFHEQYLREDRLDLKQVFKQRNLAYKLNEPRLKIVVDQGLERWMNDDGADNDYQEEINEHRSRIDRMKLQTTRYQDVVEKVKESKSRQMLQESSRKVREEEAKIEEAQKLIQDLWNESYDHGKKEWDAMKQMIVKFSQSCTECNMMDLEMEAVVQNNEIKRVKIVQLHEEIERAKLEQEEEAKRREIELNERILIPIKITPMILENSMFKNPNDFPALIDKIESTRRSYEQIFKRPEYMDLRKLKRKNKKSRSKCSTYFDLLFSEPKRKGKIRKPKTSDTATESVVVDKVSSHPDKHQHEIIASESASIDPSIKIDKPSAAAELFATKCLPESETDLTKTESKSHRLMITHEQNRKEKISVTHKRKASNKSTDDQYQPIRNVQEKRHKQRPFQSVSQPELPGTTRDNAQSEPPRKRPSLETPISASAPSYLQDYREFKKPQEIQEHSSKKASHKSKPKKVAFHPQLERDNFSFSPEKSNRQTKPMPKQQPAQQTKTHSPSLLPLQMEQQLLADPIDIDPQERDQKTVDDDNFSFGSASPPLDSRQSKDDGDSFFDTGSISSFDMDDREGSSDLGFDLSPVAPRTANLIDEHGEGSGSDGNTSDFDFLVSPPKYAAQSGSQSGGKKGQDCFAFTDDDSGTGFDFF